MCIEEVVVDGFARRPEEGHERLAGEHTVRLSRHHFQEQELLRRQRYDFVPAHDLVAVDIDSEVFVGDGGGRCGATPKHRFDARDELFHRERLDHVVVRTGAEALDAVADAIAGSEHDDRDFGDSPGSGSRGRCHRYRQQQVEDDEVGDFAGDGTECGLAIDAGHHFVTPALEPALENRGFRRCRPPPSPGRSGGLSELSCVGSPLPPCYEPLAVRSPQAPSI